MVTEITPAHVARRDVVTAPNLTQGRLEDTAPLCSLVNTVHCVPHAEAQARGAGGVRAGGRRPRPPLLPQGAQASPFPARTHMTSGRLSCLSQSTQMSRE